MKLSSQMLEVIEFGFSLFKEKPKLTGSQWADRYFWLSPESSSRPGKWHTDPWQVEILDEMTNLTTPFVDVEKSARVGYTKMLNITQGYFIHQDPCSILHAQPTDDEIRGYAEDEFEPMTRDNEVIRHLINTDSLRGRNKKEKTVKKMYPGGIWEGIGAHSPRNFRRRTTRVTIGDEIDGWQLAAGEEGDQVLLLHKRSSGFWNRKNITGGTPTVLKASRVHKRFEAGDQRQRFLPCPYCGHMQTLEFENFRWEVGDDSVLIRESVAVECIECHKLIRESQKYGMDLEGEWIASKPFKGRASFRIWSAYAHDPHFTWADIVQEWLDAMGDDEAEKVFTNTVLGLPWEEKRDIAPPDDLLLLRNDTPKGVVPNDTYTIAMGVDVQLDHFWVQVAALKYGAGKHFFFNGRVETWADVERVLYTQWSGENGGYGMVNICAVDSGFKRDEVYEFCAMHSEICIPVKGASGKPKSPWIVSNVERDIDGRTIATGLKLYIIDTEYFKDMLHSQIQRSIEMAKRGETAHDNLLSVHAEADQDWAKQMTSEYKHCEVNKKTGVEKWDWRKISPKADNHQWDDAVYITFLGELLGIRFMQRESIAPKREERRRPPASTGGDYTDNF
ncbi:terminase gpA endonuclease subunit [Sulfurimonas sp. ST-25]|uniref:terminase gpA endonuclease subunit n=1 Tax=Sulfurimonas sp. ST-25 TaxID=3400151 RepID=UPI003A851466